MSSPPSPERRSTADLQRILDSLIGDKEHVLSGNLPDVLLAYEREHDLVILDPAEYDGLRTLCAQYNDLELGAKDLFNFLSMIPKPQPARNTSSLNLPHSASLPPTAFRNLQNTPRASRRHSDRIRDPSDSSSSDDEIARPRQASAPPQETGRSLTAFPSSGSGNIAPRPYSRRAKTLSDPSKRESPLSGKVRGAQPPSAFTSSGAFARPSPASRRRRGSAGGQSATSEHDDGSQSFGRNVSSSSLNDMAWGRDSRAASPISPNHGIDSTSFHRAKSPEVVEEEGPAHDGEVHLDDTEDANLEPTDSRFSRSTESTMSLRTSHDKLQELQKQNTELGRRLKESERQLSALGAENERLVEDLQEKLEEARSEIAQKRKDEKELKSKDRAQLIQIAGFEADIQSLQRSLESSRENHANMQRMYNSQCDEAQRLRDLLRDRDDEIDKLEEAAQTYGADEEKFTREVQVLEAEVKRLEQDLSLARQAESHLEVQKQENLALKETIDRMRYELDEAKAIATNVGGHTRNATGSSGPGTLSRNLGDELHRRLAEAEKLQEEEEEEEDSVIETIVTRTRKVGHRNPSSSGPSVKIDEIIREYADASTETDPLPSSPAGPSNEPLPPAYTAEAEPVNAQQVPEKAHPRGIAEGIDDAYDEVVGTVGVRCLELENELKGLNLSRGKSRPGTKGRSFAARRRVHYASGNIVNYILYHAADTTSFAAKVAACTVTAFAVGIIFGAHLYAIPGGLHPRDYALFNQMNTLALASGAGEGFLPKGMMVMVESGAKLVAGKVPS